MQAAIDHLVIGATDLARGVAYVREQLGVEIPFGGEHASMGTHNHLMRLGDDVFLEVIAANPEGQAPPGPRWYALDDPWMRRQIEARPLLLTWVINTGDIRAFMGQSEFSFGRPTQIRRGELSWHFGLPRDGRLLAGGILPYVIQWQTDRHPAGRMADLGCRLKGLEVFHPRAPWIESILTSVGAAGLVRIRALPAESPPYLAAHIETPAGVRVLRSGPQSM